MTRICASAGEGEDDDAAASAASAADAAGGGAGGGAGGLGLGLGGAAGGLGLGLGDDAGGGGGDAAGAGFASGASGAEGAVVLRNPHGQNGFVNGLCYVPVRGPFRGAEGAAAARVRAPITPEGGTPRSAPLFARSLRARPVRRCSGSS